MKYSVSMFAVAAAASALFFGCSKAENQSAEDKGNTHEAAMWRSIVPDNGTWQVQESYDERNTIYSTDFIRFLKDRGVSSVFHYVPLHSAPAGLKYGRFAGEDEYTTKESERLTRLPLYFGLKEEESKTVLQTIRQYFHR